MKRMTRMRRLLAEAEGEGKIYQDLSPIAQRPTLAGVRMWLSIAMAEWKSMPSNSASISMLALGDEDSAILARSQAVRRGRMARRRTFRDFKE